MIEAIIATLAVVCALVIVTTLLALVRQVRRVGAAVRRFQEQIRPAAERLSAGLVETQSRVGRLPARLDRPPVDGPGSEPADGRIRR